MERSAAGWRRVMKTVAALPRRESWATWPSTHTSPSRPIHSATLRATVRTGHGASGEEGAVTPPPCQPPPTPPLHPRAGIGIGGYAYGFGAETVCIASYAWSLELRAPGGQR